MLLSVQEANKLNSSLDRLQQKISLEGLPEKRKAQLRIYENVIFEASQKFLLDSGLIKHILKLGTAYRRGSFDLRLIAAATFELIKRLQDKNLDILHLRFIVFSAVSKANEFDEFKEIGLSLLWKDEREKLLEYLSKPCDFDYDSLDRFQEVYDSRLSIMRRGGQITLKFWDNIEKLVIIAKNKNDKNHHLAISALSYLVEERDIVDDRLGLFGLVDDIEVIQIAAMKIYPSLVAETLIEEFLSIDNSLLSLLVERQSSKSGTPKPLTTLSKPMLMSIISNNYLLQTGSKRILSIFPDKGMIALPQIVSLMLSSDGNSNETENEPLVGSKLYFNLPMTSLEVTYNGKSPHNSAMILVGEENASYGLPQEVLKFTTDTPLRAKVEQNAKKVNDWLKQQQTFIPPHVSFSSRRYSNIIVLTKKNKFEKNLQGFMPFGVNVAEFIDFVYETQNGKLISLNSSRQTKLDARVYVYSNADLAIDRIEDGGFELSQTLLICDEEKLAENFLGGISDAWGFEKISMIFFADLQSVEVRKIAQERNFKIIAMHTHFEELADEDLISQHGVDASIYDDPLSKFEAKIIRSTRKPDYEFMPLSIELLDKFKKLERKLWKEDSDGLILQENKFLWKFRELSALITKRWLPIESVNVKKFNDLTDLTLELGRVNAAESEVIEKLINLIEEERTGLMGIPNSRGVLAHLRNNPLKNFAIFTEFETNKSVFNEYFNKNEISNCEIFTKSSLSGNFIEKPLIVPYLPSEKFARLLTSSTASSRLELFFSEIEKSVFMGRRQQALKQNRQLSTLNAKSFANTRVEGIMGDIIKRAGTGSEIIEKETDTYIREKLHIHSTKYHREAATTSEVLTESIPIYFDDSNRLIFVAPRSSMFIVNDNNEFSRNDAKELTEGDRFCLLTNAKSDILDFLAASTNHQYVEKKTLATSWKLELKNILVTQFFGDVQKMRQYLEANKIKRTEVTVKNWLNDSSLVAPQKFAQILKNIANLQGVSLGYRERVSDVISAVEFCYGAKRSSEEALLKALNTAASFTERGTKVKTRIGGSLHEFDVLSVSAISGQITVPVSDLWNIREVS